MQLYLFSVYDKAVKAFMQPFFSRSRGEAIRSFTDAVNDEKSNFRRHSMDFVLYALGEFDDNSGLFKTAEPDRVVSAEEVRIEEDVFPPEKRVSNA